MWGKDALIYCDLSDKVVSFSVSNEGRKYILKKKIKIQITSLQKKILRVAGKQRNLKQPISDVQ